jgi:hypothetical protein
MSMASLARASRKCSGRLTFCAHQLPIRSENPAVPFGGTDGPEPACAGVVCRTVPPLSTRAIDGAAGRRQDAAPWFVTTMSDPRLPAAPPHGPPVAPMSALVQGASAVEALGAALAAADADGDADGASARLGLGLGALPHAPTSRAPRTVRAAIGEGRGRPRCATVGAIKSFLQGWVRSMLAGHSGRGRNGVGLAADPSARST